MAIKIKGTTILDDNRNLLSGNTITASSFVGPLTGNAATVTNGVYTTGNQTIAGIKSFTANTIFDTDTLFVDAVNNRVGVGTAGTGGIKLDVEGSIRTSTGVLFGTDTAAANTLDDYEEGNWTPVLSDGTNNATAAVGNGGQYIKIGRQVTCTGRVITSSLGSANGAIRVTGLPFTVQTVSAVGSAAIGYGVGLAIPAGYTLGGRTVNNTNYIQLYLWDVTTGVSPMQATEWSDDGDIYLTVTYLTA